jgi:hypothetical protein
VTAVWAAARSAIATALTASNAKEMLRIKTTLCRNRISPFQAQRMDCRVGRLCRNRHQQCEKIERPHNAAANPRIRLMVARLRKNGTGIHMREKY